MKTYKNIVWLWLAVISLTFISCSQDTPIEEEQIEEKEETKNNSDDQNDKNGEKDGNSDNAESVYKVFNTNKRISKIVIDAVTPNTTIKNKEDHAYIHELFQYDEKGRIAMRTRYILETRADKKDTIKSDTAVWHFSYRGNLIYVINVYDVYNSKDYKSDYEIELNSDGYRSICEYDKDGHPISTDDYTYLWKDGNLVSVSSRADSYSCTYTEYLNDMSVDMTPLIKVRSIESTIDIPTDINGKRVVNLPNVKTITPSTSNIQIHYSYELDSMGRVSKITVRETSDYNSHTHDYDVYNIYYN